MLDFIKRNKMFCGCLLFCTIIIILLSSLILMKDFGKENTIIIPPIKNEEVIEKDPEISLFTGSFSDENNMIHVTWDFEMNGHTFQKVELYYKDVLLKTLYSERSFDVSIFEHGLCTGDNEFELQVYYDNGMIVSKFAEVFVDYVFDLAVDYQLVNNNLGKGYLVTFSYSYNTNTPVGVPLNNATKITTLNKTSIYWSWKYLTWSSNQINDEYQNTRVYYFIALDDFVDQDITWQFDVRLDSVGVRFENDFTHNPLSSIPTEVELFLE